ncbi:hypothetical protein RSOL_334230, partial [Rhizoctonia solani AG-3 Rhs1AP]
MAVSFGAEAQLPTTTEEQAEDNGWVLAKHFKLHLYPSDMLARHGLTLDPLPHGVSLSRIYSDFLGYLLHHTKTYFEDRILDGKSIWEQYSPAMEIGRRHRRVLDPGPGVEKNFVRDVLRPGMNFAICEADDSIVKSTLYSVISMRPTVKLREQRATVCTQAGSAFVGLEAEKFLRKSLENIGLPVDRVVDYTRAGVEDFRRITARLFMDEASTYSIAFAPISFNNPAINTRRGRMMVPGVTIKGFFDVYVKQIMESVDQQLDFNAARGLDTSYTILAGTFGDSPYLRQEFRKRYEPQGRRIILPNDSTSKAVAEGAVIWKITYGSSDRALQLSWGVETLVTFDYNNPDHQGREKIRLNTTWTVTPGRWKCFAIKGITPDKNSIIRIPFSLDFPSHSDELGPFELKIYTYSGNDEPADAQIRLSEREDELARVHILLAQREEEIKALKSAHENELKDIQEKSMAEKADHDIQRGGLCNTIREQKAEITELQSRNSSGLKEAEALKQSAHENELKNIQKRNMADKSDHGFQHSSLCKTTRDEPQGRQLIPPNESA